MPSGQDESPKKVAAVVESWRRIETWLETHLPACKLTLKPGLSKTNLAKFEKAIGAALPEDVRRSWLIHDGQRLLPDDELDALNEAHFEEDEDSDYEYPNFIGLIFGHGLLNFLTRDCPMTGKSALGEWQGWAKMADEGYDASLNQWQTSSPEGSIKLCYANRGWIPLVALTDVDYIGVDLDPGPSGVIGQVINFGRDEEKKYVLATSWAQFLSDVADEWKAGNFAIDLREEFEEFRMIRPRLGRLRANVKEWSAAKIAGHLIQ